MTPLIFLILTHSAHSSEWVSLSDTLNPKQVPLPETLTSRHAMTPSMTFWKGNLYLSWTEPEAHGIQQVYIKKLKDGVNWEQVGKSQNKDRTNSSASPSFGTNGNDLFLCWTEKNDDNISQVYVKQLIGTNWQLLGGSLNTFKEKEAKSPMLALFNGVPYVAWNESSEKEWSKLYVKHWDGSAWIPDGQGFGLEAQHITQAPYLLFDGNKGHLVWAESDEMRIFQIHYAKLEGGKWNELHVPLNQDPKMQAFNPSLSLFKNDLYLVFQEKSPDEVFRIQLRHLTPDGWRTENSRLKNSGKNSFNPVLAFDHETQLVAWEEWEVSGIPNIAVQALTQDGESKKILSDFNQNPERFRLNPILITNDQSAYLAWKETANSDLYQVQIRKYQP
ncbi:MAG: hypothetical protein ACHQYP_02105 [Nitrospiria bacterium]